MDVELKVTAKGQLTLRKSVLEHLCEMASFEFDRLAADAGP